LKRALFIREKCHTRTGQRMMSLSPNPTRESHILGHNLV
jgi:hypothetical protein